MRPTDPLPIDAVLPKIAAALQAGPNAVLVAPPGAGKTTRVPLALLDAPDASRIALLFSDVVLPGGMTGADLASAARSLHPELKVLFTTGYARDVIVHGGRLDAGVALITKPFDFADLAARIRAMLDG